MASFHFRSETGKRGVRKSRTKIRKEFFWSSGEEEMRAEKKTKIRQRKRGVNLHYWF